MSHFPWSEPILKYFVRRTKAARSWDYLEETGLKLIEDRRNTMTTIGSTPHDILQILLEAFDESEETKFSRYLNNEEILVIVTSMLLASYETTMNALRYTAYLLSLNPTIYKIGLQGKLMNIMTIIQILPCMMQQRILNML